MKNNCDIAQTIHDAFMDCLCKSEDKNPDNQMVIEGITCKFALNPTRLETKRELVQQCINNLPTQFKEGYTFMAMPMTKSGAQWGEQANAQELLVMALGLNLMKYCFPKEYWSILPGGVPYVQTTN